MLWAIIWWPAVGVGERVQAEQYHFVARGDLIVGDRFVKFTSPDGSLHQLLGGSVMMRQIAANTEDESTAKATNFLKTGELS